MALSAYDKANLSKEDQAKILTYTAAWEAAKKAGNTQGMADAHAAAEAVRSKAGYSGGDFGDRYIPVEVPTPQPSTPQVSYNYVGPTSWNRPTIKSGRELAALYDIDYDPKVIEDALNTATKAQYKALRDEFDATANQFYNQMYGVQNTALDTIRKSNAEAVATGASRGIQAANELSAILGLQDTMNETATDLTQQRNQLASKEQAALFENVLTAMDKANTLKTALANLASNYYASDVQFDVGEMNFWAAINQAAQALAGTKYSADMNYAGVKDTNVANKEIATTQAKATTEAATISGEATKEAAKTSAKGTVDAASVSGFYNTFASWIAGEATKAAAVTAAEATKEAAKSSGTSIGVPTVDEVLKQALEAGNKALYIATLTGSGVPIEKAEEYWKEATKKPPNKSNESNPLFEDTVPVINTNPAGVRLVIPD